MTVTAAALRELHRIHQQLADLRGRLDRGPKQVKAGEANCQRLQGEQEAAKEALTRSRVSADEKQLQLRQREDRIKDLQAKLNSCGSNREYQALKEQIAADQQANLVLEDEILETLEKIDEQRRGVSESEAIFARVQQELEKTRQRVAEEQAGLQSELARVQDSLEEAEQALPADLRADYRRLAAVRGEAALAPVDGDVCGGCFQVLTPQTLNDLYLSKAVFCKSCGCLLYLPEDRSVGGR